MDGWGSAEGALHSPEEDNEHLEARDDGKRKRRRRRTVGGGEKENNMRWHEKGGGERTKELRNEKNEERDEE